MSSPTRTYRGRAVDELIPRIQQELGAEAIIVRRREGLTGGILGFFQHPFVEIEAMPGGPRIDLYDEDDQQPPPPSLPPAAFEPDPPGWVGSDPPAPRAPTPERLVNDPWAQPGPWAPPAAPSRPAPGWVGSDPPAPRAPTPEGVRRPPPTLYSRAGTTHPEGGSAYVTAHLAALARADREAPAPPRDFQELIPRGLPEPFPPAPAAEEYPVRPPRAPSERRVVAPGSHARARARASVEKGLRRFGISEELAQDLIDGARAHNLPLAPRSGLAEAVRATLIQRIPVAPPLPVTGAAIVVVGAGGAGKTTCCAALLGAYRKSSSLPASCATLTRAERGELQMILSPQIMRPTSARAPRALAALRRAREEGMAVVDTPRLSPAERAGIRELANVLGELKPERVVVALPATLGATAAAQLLQALRPLGANALAVTHAEETDQIGVAVEAACTFGLAPEYMLDRARSGGWRLSRIDPTALAAKLLQ
jgi:hypothetical protein